MWISSILKMILLSPVYEKRLGSSLTILTDWLAGWLTDWLTDLPTDWPLAGRWVGLEPSMALWLPPSQLPPAPPLSHLGARWPLLTSGFDLRWRRADWPPAKEHRRCWGSVRMGTAGSRWATLCHDPLVKNPGLLRRRWLGGNHHPEAGDTRRVWLAKTSP